MDRTRKITFNIGQDLYVKGKLCGAIIGFGRQQSPMRVCCFVLLREDGKVPKHAVVFSVARAFHVYTIDTLNVIKCGVCVARCVLSV